MESLFWTGKIQFLTFILFDLKKNWGGYTIPLYVCFLIYRILWNLLRSREHCSGGTTVISSITTVQSPSIVTRQTKRTAPFATEFGNITNYSLQFIPIWITMSMLTSDYYWMNVHVPCENGSTNLNHTFNNDRENTNTDFVKWNSS